MSTDSDPLQFSNLFQKPRQLYDRVDKALQEKNIDPIYKRSGTRREIIVSYAGIIIANIQIIKNSDCNQLSRVKCIHGGKQTTEVKYPENYENWEALENDTMSWLRSTLNWLEGVLKNTDTAR